MVRLIKESNDSNYDKIAKTNPKKFAEIIAKLAQDMDWMDYVDDTLETPDEMWDDFVDNTYDALMNDPESVKDMIDDYGESDDPEALEIADLIDRYYINKNESIRRNRTYPLIEAKAPTLFDIDYGYDCTILELSNTPTNGMYKLKAICLDDNYDSEPCITVSRVSKQDYEEIKSHINDQENAFDGCGLGQLWSEAEDIQQDKAFYEDDIWKAIASNREVKAFIKNVLQYVKSNNMKFFEQPFQNFVWDIDEDDKKSMTIAKKVAEVLELDINDFL